MNHPSTSSDAAASDSLLREIQIEFLIHELKDPVAVIETGARTLLERPEKNGPLTARQEKALRRILKNAQKTRDMLYGLLEVGQSQAGCFTWGHFKPIEVVYRALLAALETTATSIYDDLPPDTGPLNAADILLRWGIEWHLAPEVCQVDMYQDATKFGQIAGNLLKNALHYRRQRLHVRMACQEQVFFLWVEDDGPGIDPQHHTLIFQRYAQLKVCDGLTRAGHGLGLAGARILARCLGGDIVITSKKGQGAVFCLKLPLVRSPDLLQAQQLISQ